MLHTQEHGLYGLHPCLIRNICVLNKTKLVNA
jgi:hypothetical protein